MNGNHIEKGFHEYDMQMPLDVTLSLLRNSKRVCELKPWFQIEEELSQFDLSRRLLKELTTDVEVGQRQGKLVIVGRNPVTIVYAGHVPIFPIEFGKVTAQLRTSRGSVADPSSTALPDTARLPNYSLS